MSTLLKNCISSSLHTLLGYTSSTLESYILSLFASSPTKSAFLMTLKTEAELTGDVNTFVEKIWKFKPVKPQKIKSKEKLYTTLSSDDDDDSSTSIPVSVSKKSKKDKKSKKSSKRSKSKTSSSKEPSLEMSTGKRRRASSTSSDSADDTTTVIRKKISATIKTEEDIKEDEKDEQLSAEALEAKDARERDEFAKRLIEKDLKSTKKIMKVEDPPPSVDIERLREESRRRYLDLRSKKELKLLEMTVKDEEELFKDVKRSAAEIEQHELNKRILAMAAANEDGEADEIDGYVVPDGFLDKDGMIDKGKKEGGFNMRYKEDKLEKSEQELWEESQTAKASHNSKKKNDGNEYELVFEDVIEFVNTEKKKAKNKKGEEIEGSGETQELLKEDKTMSEYDKIQISRKNLPVYAYREEFLSALKDHQVLILVGETGSGKTTQIPQYLHESGYTSYGKVACTQPRRVAAMSVAARVSVEMGVELGKEVGYSIRFEDCTCEGTKVQYMTDGMLLRSFLTEPDLKSFSALIIDEAHERTLHTDILFGLVKDIVRFRKDLKLIISSATLDAEKFSSYLDDAPIFMIPGRCHSVDILYTKQPEADYVDASVVTTLQIHVTQKIGSGDILIFLTGQEEIEQCAETLTARTKGLGSKIPELIICPIYANLPSDQQAKIFDKTPPNARKVVIATNIAETSLTIDGICYVIDSGFAKQTSYNPKTGMSSLVVTPISQAAANQRSGRAGRTAPGKCFRLFTAWSFKNELDENTVPEIQRTNMGNVVLQLKALGINDLLGFDFMDAPPAETLMRAFESLYALGALNDKGELTKLGRRMAEFPLEPMLSKTVIYSEKLNCTKEVLSMVSMLSIGASVFYVPKDKKVHAETARLNFARGGGGDQISLLRCYTRWEESEYSTQWCFENFVQVKSMRKARDIRDQLEGLCERVEIEPTSCGLDEFEPVLKCFTAGFFFNVAKLSRSGDYTTVKNRQTCYLHPSSVLAKDEVPAKWLAFFELSFTTKEFMRQCAPIKGEWMVELAPHYYSPDDIEEAKGKKVPKQRSRGR
ncbi:hypothetical protein TrVE_jg109 [Triparma verrucosa]|uniref:RNA helicase n=1 Tax=Triparma verrucosa TaxID=1606542 RepID=A0A9W7FKV6_9STRA|nr:hypothetical protein TrVE_jg109 [Triparma verrucosa]